MTTPIYYCLGFLFDELGENVILIGKKRPDWQAGLFNGIGGHCNEKESPASAMYRESKEETGCTPHTWLLFCTLAGRGFNVACFKAFEKKAFNDAKTTGDENIVRVSLKNILDIKAISSVPWLVLMANDKNMNQTVQPFEAVVNYK